MTPPCGFVGDAGSVRMDICDAQVTSITVRDTLYAVHVTIASVR
jgi:hypothetical protein